MTASKLSVQSTADRMTKYDRRDYIRDDIQGACPLFSAAVYTLKGPHKAEFTAGGERRELTNKLKKHNVRDLVDFVIAQFKEWTQLETNTQSADDGSVTVWVSDTLQHDLGIPLRRNPPDCVILQAVVVGRNLPALVLTLYQSDKTPGAQDQKIIKELRAFTTETAQLLTASMIRFSHSDFVLLPCVLSIDELEYHSLKTEIDSRFRFSSRYYRGPGQLNNESYNDLKEAIVAVLSASYVPFLLEEDHKQKEWILLLEESWRDLVLRIIETVTRDGACDLVYTPQTGFKVKVAILEAVRRLVFTGKVSITTSDPDVVSCVQRIIQQIEQEHGADVSEKLEVIQGISSHISIACPGRTSTDTDQIPLKEDSAALSQQYGSKRLSHQKMIATYLFDKTYQPSYQPSHYTYARDKPHHISSTRSAASQLEVQDLIHEIDNIRAKHGPADLSKVDKDELTLKELQLEKALLYAQSDHARLKETDLPQLSTYSTSSPEVDDAMKPHKLARMKSSPGRCVGESTDMDTFNTDTKILGSTWPSRCKPFLHSQ